MGTGSGRPSRELIPCDRLGLVKTLYYTAASLDGFIATLDDSLKWLFPLGDLEATSYPTFIRDVGALAMGSATYEWLLRHVVGPEAKRSQPWPYPAAGLGVQLSRAPVGTWRRHSLRPRRRTGRCTRRWSPRLATRMSGSSVGESWQASSTITGLLDELFVQVGSVTLGPASRCSRGPSPVRRSV